MTIEYGDPAIEWEEANAANADGQAVIDAEREAEEALRDKQIADATKRWFQALTSAHTAVAEAQKARRCLADVDWEFSESSKHGTARRSLADALLQVENARSIAGGLPKPIIDAEKDAELARLRDEVDQLRRRLADHDCSDSDCDVCGDGPGEAAASASARAILAEDAARYHGFVTVLDGTLRFCALAPGHEEWCVDSDGHVIVTAAGPADAPQGEGSDLD